MLSPTKCNYCIRIQIRSRSTGLHCICCPLFLPQMRQMKHIMCQNVVQNYMLLVFWVENHSNMHDRQQSNEYDIKCADKTRNDKKYRCVDVQCSSLIKTSQALW